MIKSVLASAALAVSVIVCAAIPASAQVYVQIAPPAPIVETVPAAPGAGYTWVAGYYRWNGTRYVWVHGHYERHGGHWCGGHWRHAAGGYYWVEGHWC